MQSCSYVCPQCFHEVGVLRRTGGAGEHQACPFCAGEVWRLNSGHGSNDGSCLQTSRKAVRHEYAVGTSGGAEVATATVERALMAGSRFSDQSSGVAVAASSTMTCQPNGRSTSSLRKWGIASLSRRFRKGADVSTAEEVQSPEATAYATTMEDSPLPIMRAAPAESCIGEALGADQRIWYPSTSLRPEEKHAELGDNTESVVLVHDSTAAPSDEPSRPASHAMQGSGGEPGPAVPAQTRLAARYGSATTSDRTIWPRSNFEWFLLVTVVQALTVVPLVWVLAVVVS